MTASWKRIFFAPQPVERLAFFRIGIPLAVLGFLMLRLIHADTWLGSNGFWVPRIEGRDWRQPFYLPPMPVWLSWVFAAVTILSALAAAAGYRTRTALITFLACLVYASLADRMEAFTVNKLGTALITGLVFTPCGAAYGWDAWRAARRGQRLPDRVTWGNVRYFQCLLVILYCLSGISKLQGDWLTYPYVLWTHMQDSYQTFLTPWVANHIPTAAWPWLSKGVLTLETLAPLWFSWPKTRMPALIAALGMHAFIGLCFGPVLWFALLMMALVLGSFAPLPWLAAAFRRLRLAAAGPAARF